MKKVKIMLLGALLVTVVSCKKAEKVETEKPTNRIIGTLAGSGAATFTEGTGFSASFSNPQKMSIDAAGNIYVADQKNHRIRKITKEGVVSTIAGNGVQGYADGNGASAQFNNPFDVTVDGNGNLYVADSGNHCIRKITPSGIVSTLAGLGGSSGFAEGTGTEARFNYPYAVAVDKSNNVFVADINNNRIRKVTPTGVVTTYAGNGESYFLDGPRETATIFNPACLAFDSSGNLYVGQYWIVRKITPEGQVSLLAGSPDSGKGFGYIDGAALGSKFYFVNAIAINEKGELYIADGNNNIVRKIATNGVVSTYAGIQYLITGGTAPARFKDGPANDSYIGRPSGIAVDKEGNVYVSENDGHRIRKISETPIPDSPDEIARKNWNNPTGWK